MMDRELQRASTVIAVGMLVIAAAAQAQSDDTTVKALLERADRQYADGQYGAALPTYEAAFSLAPSARILLAIARTQDGAGERAGARATLLRLLRDYPREPETPVAFELLARVERELQEQKSARPASDPNAVPARTGTRCSPACGAGETCSASGACVPVYSRSQPAARVVPTPGPAATRARAPQSNPHTGLNVHVDVLGALLLGLVPAIEVGGERVSVSARARIFHAGALSYFLVASVAERTTLGMSYAAGGSLRLYSGSIAGRSGLYGGLGAEYWSLGVESEPDQERYSSKSIVPFGEAGYRWIFGDTLVDVGLALHMMLVLSKSTDDLSGGRDRTLYPNTASNRMFPLFVINVGYYP